jgi:hypothetical protein
MAIDESLFTHYEQGQVWVVGGIETKLKNIRLDIIRVRNSSNLEKFILNHFREDTHFTHDSWAGYNFLNNNISYIHETHVNGGGDFGYSLHSTSYIEGLWMEIKKNDDENILDYPNE